MMQQARWKVQRALGLELPGLGKPGALEKRNYPPGQHGKTQNRKLSGYALQLREKQKLIFHYGIREEQLRRFVREARGMRASNWVDSLISLLERRLDNVIFRLGFAPSMAGARQLISHGHVIVNRRRVTIGSLVLYPGDFVWLNDRALALDSVQGSLQRPRLEMPDYLRWQEPLDQHRGMVISLAGSRHVPFPFDGALVAEYYAQRGV